ncbi:hypothetical protein EIP91_011340 [Steccherinum ochraceum]|uniref:Uncharacterized protein n=1 Tax=Steccherinum ochraceum TaxID=92696 RepID=A0A4V2MUT9_9APHY|nr:hypothetical protein EIP91_011340 [Steccherinum ochraceum]
MSRRPPSSAYSSPPPSYQSVPPSTPEPSPQRANHHHHYHHHQPLYTSRTGPAPHASTQPLYNPNVATYGTVRAAVHTPPAAPKLEHREGILKKIAYVALILFAFFSLSQYFFLEAQHQIERSSWERDRKAHAAELREWDRERAERGRERVAFERERQQEIILREQERAAFEREQAEWARQREAHKPFWGTPYLESPACLAYETRRYKARLLNVPLGADWYQACMSTSVEIHGRTLSTPERCEYWNDDVYGSWRVDFDEPECRPRWGDQTWHKGCLRPGIYGLEAPLWGQKYGDDIWALCMTTPGWLSGYPNDMGHPTYCKQEGDRDIGMVGRWEVPDDNCW